MQSITTHHRFICDFCGEKTELVFDFLDQRFIMDKPLIPQGWNYVKEYNFQNEKLKYKIMCEGCSEQFKDKTP
jgi:hypothetical protein